MCTEMGIWMFGGQATFEVSTVFLLKIQVLWDATPCCLLKSDGCFRDANIGSSLHIGMA